mmetsp:Transcript_10242/g.62584  ORF Transcript_10242/g.62584 Transcript_10242/m.62584 type:complete len:251 (-) Transcript_10242:1434-2186(-)
MEPFSGGDERSEPFGRVGVDEAAWRMRRVDTAKKRRAQHEMAAKGKVQVVGPPPDWEACANPRAWHAGGSCRTCRPSARWRPRKRTHVAAWRRRKAWNLDLQTFHPFPNPKCMRRSNMDPSDRQKKQGSPLHPPLHPRANEEAIQAMPVRRTWGRKTAREKAAGMCAHDPGPWCSTRTRNENHKSRRKVCHWSWKRWKKTPRNSFRTLSLIPPGIVQRCWNHRGVQKKGRRTRRGGDLPTQCRRKQNDIS